jgi:hypothetical protein
VLLIVLFHIHEWYGYTVGVLVRALSPPRLPMGPSFFFALSGFILFYAYGARFGGRANALEAIGPFSGERVGPSYDPARTMSIHDGDAAEWRGRVLPDGVGYGVAEEPAPCGG